MRRFVLSDGRPAYGVACVRDGKFLSFEHGEGKPIPLIGTAQPVSLSGKKQIRSAGDLTLDCWRSRRKRHRCPSIAH